MEISVDMPTKILRRNTKKEREDIIEEIIGDDPSLRKNLGIVLVEPFGVGT